MATSVASPHPPVAATIIYDGGTIWRGKGLPNAQALAVLDERILAIGTSEEIASLKGPETKLISLEGRFVIPGFNDAHAHVLGAGESLLTLDLRDARSEEEMVAKAGAYIAQLPKGRWLTRGRWDHELWAEKKLPSRKTLDAVSPQNPVLFPRVDGHMALANSLALKLAKIDRKTQAPPGGTIERDAKGEPTGILVDNAIEMLRKVIPEPTLEENVEAARAALAELARNGVTSIQDNSGPAALRAYLELARRGELTSRVSFWRDVDGLDTLERAGISGGFGDRWLRMDAIKLFADGSMGAASAAFFEPYEGNKGNKGLLVTEPAALSKAILKAVSAGFAVNVHAIGDQAVSTVLDSFLEVRKKPDFKKTRLRIEHSQVVRTEDIERFRDTGAIASIQPCHALTDMKWAAKRIGDRRIANAYRIASFLRAGIPVAFGTDWPVEPVDPRRGLFAAISRSFPGEPGTPGWTPEEKVTLEDALDLYTRGSAAAEGLADQKGVLSPGKLADFAVFAEDLFQVVKRDPEGILRVPVVMTVAGGKAVYSSLPTK